MTKWFCLERKTWSQKMDHKNEKYTCKLPDIGGSCLGQWKDKRDQPQDTIYSREQSSWTCKCKKVLYEDGPIGIIQTWLNMWSRILDHPCIVEIFNPHSCIKTHTRNRWKILQTNSISVLNHTQFFWSFFLSWNVFLVLV